MVDILVPLDRLADAVEADIEKSARKMIIAIYAMVDSASPIGRPELWQRPLAPKDYRPGYFKANWRVVFGTPDDKVVPETLRINVTPNVSKYRLGRPAYILNNAPYAERLAEGHSQQAPVGWLDNAIRAGVRIVSR